MPSQRNREVMGATNPENADEGTIRKVYAESIEANSVHGSDSDENAADRDRLFLQAGRNRRLIDQAAAPPVGPARGLLPSSERSPLELSPSARSGCAADNRCRVDEADRSPSPLGLERAAGSLVGEPKSQRAVCVRARSHLPRLDACRRCRRGRADHQSAAQLVQHSWSGCRSAAPSSRSEGGHRRGGSATAATCSSSIAVPLGASNPTLARAHDEVEQGLRIELVLGGQHPRSRLPACRPARPAPRPGRGPRRHRPPR